MRNLIIITAAVLVTAAAYAQAVSFSLATGTNTTATAFAGSFTGEIEDVTVYPSTGATGTVAIAVIDPFSGGVLELGSSAAITAGRVFVPRVTNSEAIGGAAARVVTNDVTAARYQAQGEQLRVSISDSTTNATYRVRIKLK